jgi:hypothetical protein
MRQNEPGPKAKYGGNLHNRISLNLAGLYGWDQALPPAMYTTNKYCQIERGYIQDKEGLYVEDCRKLRVEKIILPTPLRPLPHTLSYVPPNLASGALQNNNEPPDNQCTALSQLIGKPGTSDWPFARL